MAEDEHALQPEQVSKQLASYLDMTAPRSRASRRRPRRRRDQERTTRPPIENRGLSLEEGNDFA